MNKQSGFAHGTLIIGLVIAIIGALGFIFWQNFIYKAPVTTETEVITVDRSGSDSSDTTSKADEVAVGSVSGRAYYPAGEYPSDYRVCAVSEATKQEVICDDKIENGTYSLSVAPGSYLITTKGGVVEGYYDGYMKSGMTGDQCDPSMHTPLVVVVQSGADLVNIDAGNFYYDAHNCQ